MIALRLTALASLALSLTLIGCGNKTEGDAAAPSGKPAAASASGTAKAAGGVRDAAGKLTKAGIDAAWKAVYVDAKNAAFEPAEKKLAAFVAKVGPSAKTEGKKQIWWAFEGADCYKEELGPDGTMGSEKVTADKCEK